MLVPVATYHQMFSKKLVSSGESSFFAIPVTQDIFEKHKKKFLAQQNIQFQQYPPPLLQQTQQQTIQQTISQQPQGQIRTTPFVPNPQLMGQYPIQSPIQSPYPQPFNPQMFPQ